MKIKVIKNIDKEYNTINIICNYTIIKNCKMKSLLIATDYFNDTDDIKYVIILNCIIDKLKIPHINIGMLYITNSDIKILTKCDFGNGLYFPSEINYLKLHNSNIKFLNLSELIFCDKKFKFKTYETKNKYLDNNSNNFNYKKFNKRLFYSF